MHFHTEKAGVLILGIEPRITVPIARSLRRHDIPVLVSAVSRRDPRPFSRAISQFVRLPSYEDSDRFIEVLYTLIRERCIDMLIPTTDAALVAVGRHYWELHEHLYVTCPPPHIVDRVLNKAHTLDVAKQCGITVPSTYVVSGLAQLEALREELPFPVIAKPRHKSEESGFKVRYFRRFSELATAWEANQLGSQVLVQQYCPGEGVGIEMLIKGGECLAVFQHRRLKETPHTGGAAVVAVAEPPDPALKQAALALLRALEWEGVAMVEFRHNPADGSTALMEVNGRYWGTLSLPIQAGVDFPWYEWQLAHGKTPCVPADYGFGMKWRWTAGYARRLHGIVVRSVKDALSQSSRGKELLSCASDFRPSIRDALWSFDDPMPALLELARTVKGLLASDARAIIKRLLTRRLVLFLHRYSNLGSRERSVYLRRCVRRAMGRRWPTRKLPEDVRNIIFACHGNIMRSPMSEALLRRYLLQRPEVSVISAGVHAIPGRKADPRARKVATQFGISLDNHHAQLLSQEMVAQADIIFVMDYVNEAELLARYPEATRKIFLLGSYAKVVHGGIEIWDPYFGNEAEVRRCYTTLDSCIQNLAASLGLIDARQNAK